MKRRSPSEKSANAAPARFVGSPGNHLQSLSPQLIGKLERQKQMRFPNSSPSMDRVCKKPASASRSPIKEIEKESSENNLDINIESPDSAALDTCRAIHENQKSNLNEHPCTPSRNLDLQMLCDKWFQVCLSALNDLVGMPCILERISIFKSRLQSDEDRLLSKMGLFLKLHEIEFELLCWDESAQEFGHRDFSANTCSRARMLGVYNDIRDIATNLFGLLSDIEGVAVKSIYSRYNMTADD